MFKVLIHIIQKNLQISYLFNSQTALFFNEPVSKKCKKVFKFLLYGMTAREYWIFEEFKHAAIQNKIVQHLGGIFRQRKVCQRMGRVGVCTRPPQKNEEIAGIFVFSGSQLHVLFINLNQKFKNVKRLAVHLSPLPFLNRQIKSRRVRPGVGKFDLEIWNRGDDMIFKLGDSYIFHFK